MGAANCEAFWDGLDATATGAAKGLLRKDSRPLCLAATWAWTLINANETTAKILIWLPFLLTVLFAAKAIFLHAMTNWERSQQLSSVLDTEDSC